MQEEEAQEQPEDASVLAATEEIDGTDEEVQSEDASASTTK